MTPSRRRIVALLAALTLGASGLVRAQDVLRVATDPTFPPFEYSEDGKRVGFDVELIEAIAKVLNKKVEWTDIDFKGLIPGLLSKRFDVAASAIYITDDRKKVVDFTDSYYPGGLVIMTTKADKRIQGPDDLKGKKVAVQVGTKSVNYLKENFPSVERIEVEKNQEMFQLVEVGRADAAVTGKPAAKLYARTRGTLQVVETQLTVEEYGYAMRKDEPELLKQFNDALKKLKADGTYQQLVKKYL
ncbi:MAG TPA: transporter substrate-binding domain-containing protein [Casimicrobiaceae bacterium]|jgi:polar amino acid transport system substrate-binding protein|nr:transporter substrate-binding domain-containing protein [Casimicrobiaceae bacterium]